MRLLRCSKPKDGNPFKSLAFDVVEIGGSAAIRWEDPWAGTRWAAPRQEMVLEFPRGNPVEYTGSYIARIAMEPTFGAAVYYGAIGGCVPGHG